MGSRRTRAETQGRLSVINRLEGRERGKGRRWEGAPDSPAVRPCVVLESASANSSTDMVPFELASSSARTALDLAAVYASEFSSTIIALHSTGGSPVVSWKGEVVAIHVGADSVNVARESVPGWDGEPITGYGERGDSVLWIPAVAWRRFCLVVYIRAAVASAANLLSQAQSNDG